MLEYWNISNQRLPLKREGCGWMGHLRQSGLCYLIQKKIHKKVSNIKPWTMGTNCSNPTCRWHCGIFTQCKRKPCPNNSSLPTPPFCILKTWFIRHLPCTKWTLLMPIRVLVLSSFLFVLSLVTMFVGVVWEMKVLQRTKEIQRPPLSAERHDGYTYR